MTSPESHNLLTTAGGLEPVSSDSSTRLVNYMPHSLLTVGCHLFCWYFLHVTAQPNVYHKHSKNSSILTNGRSKIGIHYVLTKAMSRVCCEGKQVTQLIFENVCHVFWVYLTQCLLLGKFICSKLARYLNGPTYRKCWVLGSRVGESYF